MNATPLLELLEPRTLLNGGVPDPHFGYLGVASTKLDMTSQPGIAVLPDGRTLVAVPHEPMSLFTDDDSAATVYRYDARGKLDHSLGAGGSLKVPVGGYYAPTLLVRPDGHFLVIDGRLDDAPIDASFVAAAQFTADGKPDPTFGNQGVATWNLGDADANGSLHAAALTSDGKIVFSSFGDADLAHTVFARFNADGSADPTFGTGGLVSFPITGINGSETTSSLRVVPSGGDFVLTDDGGVALAMLDHSSSYDPLYEDLDESSRPQLFKLTRSGKHDSKFEGRAMDDAALILPASVKLPANVQARDSRIARTPDGKLILALAMFGEPIRDGTYRRPEHLLLLRYNPDGSIDRSFGYDGAYDTLINDLANYGDIGMELFGLSLQQDGKIVLGLSGLNKVPMLIRYNPDGTPDATFGDRAIVNLRLLPLPLSSAGSFIVGPDGAITVAGSGLEAHGRYRSPIVARLLADAGPAGLRSTVPTVVAPSNASYQFTVTWRDDYAVDGDSIDSDDVVVVGPSGKSYRVRLVSQFRSTHSSRVATYAMRPPGGSWGPNDNGTYTIRVRAGQVFDTDGNATAAMSLGRFTVRIA